MNTSDLNQLTLIYGKNECPKAIINKIFDKCQNDECLCFKLQESIIDFIFNNIYFKTYKISKKYEINFLKYLINLIELTYKNEIHEQLIEKYLSLLNESNLSESDRKYFLHFYFKNNFESKPILIEQYENIISNGTTGLHIWPASMKLIDYMESISNTCDSKTILELGSGIGLVGLYCIEYIKLKSFIFTDIHDLVLKQINSNLKYNNVEDTSINIEVLQLDWSLIENQHEFDTIFENVDMIIASDIIYDADLIPDIIKTIKYISKLTNRPGFHTVISSTIRNEDTYKKFVDELESSNLKMEIVEKSFTENANKTQSTIEIVKIFN